MATSRELTGGESVGLATTSSSTNSYYMKIWLKK